MRPLKIILSVLILLSPISAKAGLIGTQVGCSITPTPFWVCDQPSSIVGAGAEFELDIPSASSDFGFSIDISDTSILISNIEGNLFSLGAGELLTLAFEGDVLGISNFLASNVSIISSSSISFANNLLSIDLNNFAIWDVGSFVSFDLDVNETVPEPETLFLLGLGLAGIGFSRKRKSVY